MWLAWLEALNLPCTGEAYLMQAKTCTTGRYVAGLSTAQGDDIYKRIADLKKAIESGEVPDP